VLVGFVCNIPLAVITHYFVGVNNEAINIILKDR